MWSVQMMYYYDDDDGFANTSDSLAAAKSGARERKRLKGKGWFARSQPSLGNPLHTSNSNLGRPKTTLP